MLTLADKNVLREIEDMSDELLIEKMKRRCLRLAYVMLLNGNTRKADEAIRVYKRVCELTSKEVKK